MGALLPFLYFNIYPARLYLGDSGALAFGAMLGAIALMINQALVLPIIGGVFVVEAASSIIQVASFALRKGKKVFLIAPLHRHFEAKSLILISFGNCHKTITTKTGGNASHQSYQFFIFWLP